MSPPRSPSWAVLKMLAESPAVVISMSTARMPPQISAHLIRSGAVVAMAVTVPIGLVAHRVKRGLPAVLQELFQDRLNRHSPQPSPPIFIGDRKDNFPLAEQRTVGVPQRVPRVVDVGGFRRGPVQLYDLEIPALQQGLLRGVSYVEASDEKAWYGL